jgi:hypothetical protein
MRHAIRTSTLTSLVLGLAATSLLTACPDRSISKVDTNQDGVFTKDIPLSADIDILFVIDDSASTSDKQTVFAMNFPGFVAALDAFPGIGRPNLHMGVVTTSVDIGVAGFASGNTGCPHPNPMADGRLQNTKGVGAMSGCPLPNGRYIVDVSAGPPPTPRTTNYTGNLADVFTCIAQVGSTGCGFEAPLNAMKRALDGSKPENAGFVRPGAFLAIVILTDEDDCSTKDGTDGTALFNLTAAAAGPGDFRCQPLFAYKCDTAISATTGGTYTGCTPRTDSFLEDPNSYAGFLGTVKSLNQIVVALIAGDPQTQTPAVLPVGTIVTGPLTQSGQTQALALEPSCSATINGNLALGRPSIRLSEFLANFGDHGLFQSVCQSDYTAALTAVGNLLFKAVSPCLEGTLNTADSDPNNPGTQIDCTVSDVQNLNTAMQTSSALTACKMLSEGMPDPASPTPCWYTKANAACMTPTGLEIDFVRGGATPPIGTDTDVSCATAPN